MKKSILRKNPEKNEKRNKLWEFLIFAFNFFFWPFDEQAVWELASEIVPYFSSITPIAGPEKWTENGKNKDFFAIQDFLPGMGVFWYQETFVTNAQNAHFRVLRNIYIFFVSEKWKDVAK